VLVARSATGTCAVLLLGARLSLVLTGACLDSAIGGVMNAFGGSGDAAPQAQSAPVASSSSSAVQTPDERCAMPIRDFYQCLDQVGASLAHTLSLARWLVLSWFAR